MESTAEHVMSLDIVGKESGVADDLKYLILEKVESTSLRKHV